jgi:thiol-disulfide isomerase/thioredoxin
MLAIQIAALILVSGSLGGMFVFTDVYDDAHARIVSILCLSCVKLDRVISLDFTFKTANNKDHPDFIIDNLTKKGPMFLAFRTDVCNYCDDMEPLIKEIFNLEFEKEDVFSITVDFNGTDVTFMHINNDHATGKFKDLQSFYDIDGDNAVPMFTTITLGYDRGIVKPFYNTVYGILDSDYTDEQRIEVLTNIILDGIELYNENRPGFIPD